MYALTALINSTASSRNLINQPTWWRVFFLFLLASLFFALSPTARAVTPAPDGGYGNGNTAEGDDALFSNTTGSANTATGFQALFSNTTGSANTASGDNALQNNTTGSDNTANGFFALSSNTTGVSNTATGVGTLQSNLTGSDNTANGNAALASNNGSDNTASGSQALYSNTSGNYNTGDGFQALYSNKTGTYNTASGFQALLSNISGVENTAVGVVALANNTTGRENTANGANALRSNSTGNFNTAEGYGALFGNTTGSLNVAIGIDAGFNLTTGNNNIVIGANVLGNAGESGKIRLGKQGTQTATYIAGIYGKTVASGTKVGVMIDSTGKLGTVVSSARFKEAIKPMDKASEALLQLKPVTFRYRHELDPDGVSQFGLIAEQVEKVNPDLVVRDEDGQVNTVRYEAVNAMLLNEFLKEHRTVQEQGRIAQQQEARLAKDEAIIAKQQKQIEALTTGLQRVSDQVELREPLPQLVLTNH